jgi:hypothetical protein
MLYCSLIASALLLALANWTVRRSAYPGAVISLAGAAVVVGPFFIMCVMPPVAMQALLLGLALVIWRVSHRDASFFLRLSCGATLLAYALAGILVFRSEQEYARLRRLYPYESMEARLPAMSSGPAEMLLRPASEARLTAIEDRITGYPNGIREDKFRQLHEHAVELFVNSPGFGVSRLFLPAEGNLKFGLRREPVPTQPGPRLEGTGSPGEWRLPSAEDELPLGRLLEDSVFDFVNSRGFGFIKDRRHVAGFEAHRFSTVPGSAPQWEVQRLELVSLLVHHEPAVYVSDSLPEMKKTHDTPTRPLERFERVGLDELQRGEDLFLAETGNHLRMLGAVRSAKACVACHGGSRGDLLGAFSYTLQGDRR